MTSQPAAGCVFCTAHIQHGEHVVSDRVRVGQDFGEAS